MIEVEALDAPFGAMVRGVDLRDELSASTEAIAELWVEYGLLVFPGQHLSRGEQDTFARRFGDLEFTATPLTNLRRDGTLRTDPDDHFLRSLQGNEGWHHDSTYLPLQAKGAVFTAEIVPRAGGATGFADMRAAYDALDDETRGRVGGLAAHHSRRYSMERAGHHVGDDVADQLYGYDVDEPPLRPLVKVHPDTGRPNLLIGQHAFDVAGMSPGESEELLDRLNSDACADGLTYHHEWSVGDAVLWDNRRLMHRATPHDPAEPRRMWHTRIAGDPATETALDH
ncbi:TauD/TfdA dioxygenase family protein [Ilumatobacter sp.]|uniref:TauD/TfdA dioxygenase family protein n=1 Tax=Ilumatobacter sp. TaxID=1967498 RepID=UPI003AF73125